MTGQAPVWRNEKRACFGGGGSSRDPKLGDMISLRGFSDGETRGGGAGTGKKRTNSCKTRSISRPGRRFHAGAETQLIAAFIWQIFSRTGTCTQYMKRKAVLGDPGILVFYPIIYCHSSKNTKIREYSCGFTWMSVVYAGPLTTSPRTGSAWKPKL
jgi:hypothetical protein